MKKFIFFMCFLSFASNQFAQDTDKLLKYYEVIGNPIESLLSNWGEPMQEKATKYGRMFRFKEEKADFEFYLNEKDISGATLKLQPGNDDGSCFTFYIVVGLKLEKEGFKRIETNYDPQNISIDRRTHNFVKEYEISDKFQKDSIVINMRLIRSDNKKLMFESFAVSSGNQHLFLDKIKINRKKDFFKRISTNLDILLLEWGNPDERDFNSYDNSDFVTYYENNYWGIFWISSNENKIFKITYVVQVANDNKTIELFDEYAQMFEEAGYKSEKIPSEDVTVTTLRFTKDNHTITHNLFPMPREGKYPNEEVLTIETTVTN